MLYKVNIELSGTITVKGIEANSLEEAKEKAKEIVNRNYTEIGWKRTKAVSACEDKRYELERLYGNK